ncbi:MAG: IS5 family transposase [Parachlamydiaceae bacterium]|nr:IS5 family transposase [Parachlamydiaceae bacterium]
MQKSRYKINNWSDYNKALIQRGSISIWIDENCIKKWISYDSTGKAGRPSTYSDDAILMLLILRERFGLTLRCLQGFAQSIFKLMNIEFPVPSYTQICRRAKKLYKKIVRLSKVSASHIIFDSTGLKVYGEGEWKVRTHGKSKRRIWRKLHVGIDVETQDFIVCELTDHGVGEVPSAVRMLDKLDKIETFRGDGAYDPNEVRKKISEKGGRAIIPPPRHATIKGAKDGWIQNRDEDIASILELGTRETGRRPWKEKIKYFKRSLVETSIFRIKKMLGDQLKGRIMETQHTEAYCKCLVINKMNQLGLPKGKWVPVAA